MGQFKIQWKFVMASLVLVGLCLALVGGLSLWSIKRHTLKQVEQSLFAQAQLTARLLQQALAETQDPVRIDKFVDTLGAGIDTRLTVIRVDGVVIGDSYKSDGDLLAMENHLNRPEIQQALENGVGTSIRFSETAKMTMFYLALPVKKDDHLLGIARVALPLTTLQEQTRYLQQILFFALAAAFLLALLMSYSFSRRLTRSLNQLMEIARKLSRGEFGERVEIKTGDEITELAALFNQMAQELETKINTLSEEQAQLTAILSSMVEGVMVLDCRGNILLVNTVFEHMFHLSGQETVGRPAMEVLRHYPLIELIKAVLDTRTSQSQEVIVQTDRERYFQVQASVTPNCRDQEVCAVLVFHDITEIKRLERVRKDFVANVSHELRIPP